MRLHKKYALSFFIFTVLLYISYAQTISDYASSAQDIIANIIKKDLAKTRIPPIPLETRQALSDSTLYNTLANIKGGREPFPYGKYIIFVYYDEHEDTRVNISFTYEKYSQIYQYTRLKSNPKILVYVLVPPIGMFEIQYRMIVNSTWTHDIQNKNYILDSNGIKISTAKAAPLPASMLSSVIYNTNSGIARFYFQKEEITQVLKDTFLDKITLENIHEKAIYLTGNFTEWDPFLIVMKETYPNSNLYYADVHLTPGTYYYYFQMGNYNLIDPKNNIISKRKNNSYVSTIIIPVTTSTIQPKTSMIDVVLTTTRQSQTYKKRQVYTQ